MSRRQYPRKPVAIDCIGKIFGRWKVISRAGRDGDSATWNCVEIATGRERILTRRALRCHEKTCERLESEGKPLRPIRGKNESERACRPGIMFGVWRVTSADIDGSSKYERTWNVECVRCGHTRKMAENVLYGIRSHERHGCNQCRRSMPRLLGFETVDGEYCIELAFRDGRVVRGIFTEQSEAAE